MAERRKSEGGRVEDRDKGKGKGVAERGPASLPSAAAAGGDGAAGDAAGGAGKDTGDLGPVVVFSCRHVVHQRCLGAGSLTAGDSGPQRPEVACPVCSAGG